MLAAVSYKYTKIIRSIESLGIDTVSVPPYMGLYDNPESSHADMQLLRVDNTLIMLSGNDILNNNIIGETTLNTIFAESIGKEFSYPRCVKLNIAVFGRTAIGNFKYTDKTVLNTLNDFRLINVNQGYAKCSTAIVSDNAVITSDESIYKVCTENNIDCLKINSGHIELCEKYGGFIGGCCFLYDGALMFTGKIENHPDFDSIRSFCANYSVQTYSLTNDTLSDVGGVVLI